MPEGGVLAPLHLPLPWDRPIQRGYAWVAEVRCIPYWDGDAWWCPHVQSGKLKLETDRVAAWHSLTSMEKLHSRVGVPG